MSASTRLRVLVEPARRKVFVSAIDWPGLSRGGRDETAAVEALLAALPRYAPVAATAGEALPVDVAGLEVVDRIDGDAGTEFGMPSVPAASDREPLTAHAARRQAALVQAAFEAFDAIAAGAPAELRKGPRGGGRDTAKIVEHVQGANESYAAVLGIPPAGRRPPAALRAAILAILAAPSDGTPVAGKRWPPRYAAKRIAWHLLDHAWEIEDRTEHG